MVYGKLLVNPDPQIGAQYMAEAVAQLDPFQHVCPRCKTQMSASDDAFLKRCFECRTLGKGLPVVMRELPVVALPELTEGSN